MAQGYADRDRPQVIINSVCPGMVRTDIGRAVVDQGWVMKILVTAYMGVLGKSVEHGARHYVNAALRPKEEHVREGYAFHAMIVVVLTTFSGQILDCLAIPREIFAVRSYSGLR